MNCPKKKCHRAESLTAVGVTCPGQATKMNLTFEKKFQRFLRSFNFKPIRLARFRRGQQKAEEN